MWILLAVKNIFARIKWELILNIVLTGATIGLAVFTYRLWSDTHTLVIDAQNTSKKQAADMETSLKLAEKLSDAAQTSAEAAVSANQLLRDNSILSNRPYLHASYDLSFIPESENDIWYGGVNLNLINDGAIPASITKAEYYVLSDEIPNIDLMSWFNKDLGGVPSVNVVFPKGSVSVPLHPIIGKKPKLVFISSIITYTGVDPNKFYWYKFNRLFYVRKLEAKPDLIFALETLKAEEDWDRNSNVPVPHFKKPNWAFYLKNRK